RVTNKRDEFARIRAARGWAARKAGGRRTNGKNVARPNASYRAGGVTSSIERGARNGVVWHFFLLPKKNVVQDVVRGESRTRSSCPLRRADDSAEAARENKVKPQWLRGQ
ncbi:hypothetical protein, partial [Luteibacter sp. dw_328]|uniref:hypothetical protein n=1 Tax=Luteibacter sp. dw_328 TaxID=2719796 RepID=UPI001BD265E3